MAAIIAQMTRANRERKKNKCFEIVIGKCMYEIGPFPEKYEPEVSYIDSKSIIVKRRKYYQFLHTTICILDMFHSKCIVDKKF